MLIYWEQIKRLWSELSLVQKGIAILLFSLTLVFTVTMIVWSLRPDYQMLYSGLEYKNIGKVTEGLQEKKIKYRIGEDGRSILVPSKDINRAKIDMAQTDVFKDELRGYELFDENKFGATRFEQQVNLSRAKEAELTRTIRDMELVEDVRVHLVMPERRTLGERNSQPKASITLTLSNGT